MFYFVQAHPCLLDHSQCDFPGIAGTVARAFIYDQTGATFENWHFSECASPLRPCDLNFAGFNHLLGAWHLSFSPELATIVCQLYLAKPQWYVLTGLC